MRYKIRNTAGSLAVFFALMLLPFQVLARFTYEGYLTNPDGTPVVSANVDINLRVQNPAANCVIYDETHNVATSADGYFSVQVGGGAVTFAGSGFSNIFNNSFGALSGNAPCASYVPVSFDSRNLSVSVRVDAGAWDVLGALPLRHVPMAMHAENSSAIAGRPLDNLVRGASGVMAPELSSPQVTELSVLIGGTSTQYLQNGAALPAVSGAAVTDISAANISSGLLAPARGGTGVNSSVAANGQLLIGNGSGFSLATLTGGANITITNLAGGITIAATGASGLSSLNSQTGAAQTFATAVAGTSPVFSSATDVHTLNIPMASAVSVTAGLISKADYDSFAGSAGLASSSTNLNTANAIVRRDGSGNFDGGQITGSSLRVSNAGSFVSLSNPIGANYGLLLPPDDGLVGQVLTTDGAGVTTWTNSSSGPFAVGSEAVPSVTFTGDLGTGMFRPILNDLGLTTNGTEKLRIKASGFVGIGTSAPAAKLDVVGGAIRASAVGGGAGQAGQVQFGELVASGGNFVGIRAPDSLGGDYTLTLPINAGGAGNVLSTDGSGLLSWVPMPAGNAIVNGGNAFAASASIGLNDSFNLNFMTAATTRMTISNTGFVGIGQANPTSLLHVNGNNGTGGLLTLQDVNSAPSTAFRTSITAVDSGSIPVWTVGDSDPAAQKVSLKTIDAGYALSLNVAGTDQLYISSSGNLAIGSSSPSPGAKMDIVGMGMTSSSIIVPRDTTANRPTAVNGMLRYNTTTNSFEGVQAGTWVNLVPALGGPVIGSGGAAGNPGFQFSGDSDTGIFSAALDTLSFATNGVEQMTLTPSGNVGLGVLTPTQALEIQKNIPGDLGILIANINTSPSAGAGLNLVNDAGDFGSFSLGSSSNLGGALKIASSGPSGIRYRVQSNNLSAGHIFETGLSPVARMVITNFGSVGIGTTNPSARLHVDGKIAVSGPAPTIAGCGTGASVEGGSNDTRGSVTTGSTSVTACTIIFSTPFLNNPTCIVSWKGAVPVGYVVSANTVSTTQLNVGFFGGGGVTSTTWSYICMQ